MTIVIWKQLLPAGNGEMLIYLIEKCKATLNINDALYTAAENGHLNAFKYLFDKCGDNNVKIHPEFARMLAARHNHNNIIEYLHS